MKLQKRKIKNLSSDNSVMLHAQTAKVAGGFAAISGQDCNISDNMGCNSQGLFCGAKTLGFNCIGTSMIPQ
ncbi:hypothetical protein CWB73_20185 [Pseudoalteromonas phenolica]|uniref:Uncharacterized protein n=1 Tax=Pseudoalteromonas phenolica TaxID=161398 RepID=A0A5S3YP99_9GAMM|nr:hypothetical protein [Pseudoalteromonas phenolica]TMP77375.1 hypothetical protein CWB73_20185 [Pseudoalteromonas phenolica]